MATSHAIVVADSTNAPASYTLSRGESFLLRSVEWTQLVNVGAQYSFAEVVIYDPAGNLLARILGPYLPTPN